MDTNMKTLSEVMQILKKRGITKEFCMNEKGEMKLEGSEKIYFPNELKLVKSYRFEGNSSSDDNAVLYVIEDLEGNHGMLIDAYGAESNYSGADFAVFMRKIPIEERTDFNIE